MSPIRLDHIAIALRALALAGDRPGVRLTRQSA
jgi:hypothetical protein